MKKSRKHYTPEEKVAILRRHLLRLLGHDPIRIHLYRRGRQPESKAVRP